VVIRLKDSSTPLVLVKSDSMMGSRKDSSGSGMRMSR